MIPIVRRAGWLSALRDRLTLGDFKRSGAIPPAFFISANAIDCKRGKVVEIVSGAEASFMGGASISYINNPKIDQKATAIPRLPAIDLTGTAYLSFGNLPVIANDIRSFQFTAWVLPTDLLGTDKVGQPIYKRRTVLSRAFRNPGLTNTNISGWQLGMNQYKPDVPTNAYRRPSLMYNAAMSSIAYYRTDPIAGVANIWSSILYPYNDGYIKEFSLYAYRTTSSFIPDLAWHSPWGSDSPISGVTHNSSAYTPVSMIDNADNPLLVGATLDASTGSFATDFFDGKILAMGLWINNPRRNDPKEYRTVGPMKRTFMQLAAAKSTRGKLAVAPTPEPRVHYISNTSHALLPKLRPSMNILAGDVFTVGGKVFRALSSGTLSQAVAVPTTSTASSANSMLGYHVLAGIPENILVEEVTGQRPYPAEAITALPIIVAGATLVFLQDHVLASGAYIATQTIIVDTASSFENNAPVRVIVDGGKAIRTGTGVAIIKTSGNVVFDGFRVEGYGLRIEHDGGRLTVIGLRSTGRAEVVGLGDIRIFDSNLSPVMRYNPDNGTGMPQWDGSRQYNYTIFGQFVESCGPTIINMYGGSTSGRAPEYGLHWGGSFISMYGVLRIGRGGREYNGLFSGYYGTSAFFPCAGYYVGKEGALKLIGGIQGVPITEETDGRRSPPVRYCFDNLRGPGYVGLYKASSDNSNSTTIPGGRQNGLTRFNGIRLMLTPSIGLRLAKYSVNGAASDGVPAWAAPAREFSLHTILQAGATGVRIYFATKDSVPTTPTVTDVDIRIKYIHATTKKLTILKITAFPVVTVVGAQGWYNLVNGTAASVDIPIPNYLPGPIELVVRKMGKLPTGTIEYYDTTVESYV